MLVIFMNPREREKRIKELRAEITLQNKLMEGLAIQRGKNFLELQNLCEARQIEAEAMLDRTVNCPLIS